MDRDVTDSLYDRVVASYRDMAALVEGLTDEELDNRIPGYGGRETGIRQMIYTMANHTREHANHINKILKVTDAPGARPSEVQLILGQAAEALGAMHSSLRRMSDADLDRSHEDQSIQEILEHVVSANESYANYLREGLVK